MEDTKKKISYFEERVRKDLTDYLISVNAIDKTVPQCPDVEEKWTEIARSYAPDGIREFQEYPVVSLGWMMFVGMAMAFYWDIDWEKYSKQKNYYEEIRDIRGYDELDDAVVENILGYTGEKKEMITDMVARCAARVYSMLMHEKFEPGTQAAFGGYVACLHQLYLAGMEVELNALGYHMTPIGAN